MRRGIERFNYNRKHVPLAIETRNLLFGSGIHALTLETRAGTFGSLYRKFMYEKAGFFQRK
jgi:hypothetical protein